MRASFLLASAASLALGALASPVFVTTVYPTTTASGSPSFGSSVSGSPSFGSGTRTPGTTTIWTQPQPTPTASGTLYTSYVVHLSDTTYTTIVPGATPGTTHTDFGTPSISLPLPSTTVHPAYSQGTATTLSASDAIYTSYVVYLSDTTYTTIVPGATPGTTHTDFGVPSESFQFPSTTVLPPYSQGTTTLSASGPLYTSYVVHLSDTTYTTIVPGATPGTTHTDFGTPSNSVKFPSATVTPAHSQGTTTTGAYSTSLPTVGAQQLGSITTNGAAGIGMGAWAVFAAVFAAASTFVPL